MKILIDECLPKDLKKQLVNHSPFTVRDMKWEGKKNGELLKRMVNAGFEVFITIDSNLPNQQNLRAFPLIYICIKAISSDIDVLVPIVTKINRRLKNLQAGRRYDFS